MDGKSPQRLDRVKDEELYPLHVCRCELIYRTIPLVYIGDNSTAHSKTEYYTDTR